MWKMSLIKHDIQLLFRTLTIENTRTALADTNYENGSFQNSRSKFKIKKLKASAYVKK